MNTLARAKSRLADALDPESRRTLALWMAERVLRAIQESGVVSQTAIVSPDPHILAWARARSVEALHQMEGDLNAGLELGRRWSHELDADALLVLFGDLPLLTAADVRTLVDSPRQLSRSVSVVLGPDRAERGTNGLFLRPPDALPFLFGMDSFSRYLEAAQRAGYEIRTVIRDGTSFDVDTPSELDDLRALGLALPWTCDTAVSAPGGGR